MERKNPCLVPLYYSRMKGGLKILGTDPFSTVPLDIADFSVIMKIHTQKDSAMAESNNSNLMKTLFREIVPELPVKNVQESLNHFERHLGFKTVFNLNDNYAKTSRDEHSVFLAKADDAFEPRTCMISVEDVNLVYEEFVKKGAQIESEPKNLDVGTREFSIRVPGGHIFTFFSAAKCGEDAGELATRSE